jgi:hypothetical protein
MDLKITLDENSEPDFNIVAKNNLERDFSGRWKINKELKPGAFGGADIIYDIIQYESDSILIKESRIMENGREFKGSARFSFNSIKAIKNGKFDNNEHTVTCSVAPDGKTFSVTDEAKSKIGLFKDNRMKETFSLSDDGNQLRINSVYFQEGGSEEGDRGLALVFDRVKYGQ